MKIYTRPHLQTLSRYTLLFFQWFTGQSVHVLIKGPMGWGDEDPEDEGAKPEPKEDKAVEGGADAKGAADAPAEAVVRSCDVEEPQTCNSKAKQDSSSLVSKEL